MPTYEYKCKECEHSFEAVQSMKDEPLAICPECGGPVRRVLSGGAGVIFKGQGFYVTDKGKSAADGAVKKNATSTANSNTDNAGSPCSACPAAAAGAPCAAHADNAT